MNARPDTKGGVIKSRTGAAVKSREPGTRAFVTAYAKSVPRAREETVESAIIVNVLTAAPRQRGVASTCRQSPALGAMATLSNGATTNSARKPATKTYDRSVLLS